MGALALSPADAALQTIVQSNTIRSVLRALAARPRHLLLAVSGCRALEWLAESGGAGVVHEMLVEGALATCTELLRRKQRTTLTDIPEEMPAPQSDAIDHMAVMDALAELTPQMRVCMTLHYLDGWRVPEIAQMLDIPEGTVKTRLMHARKRMETLLREVET